MPINLVRASIEDAETGQAETRGASRSAKPFYLPELDILRFFAFLAVFVFHAYFYMPRKTPRVDYGLRRMFLAGAFGVDLFFALSAYLITELLLIEKERSATIDVRSFYVRRTLRIWPLYFFFLGCASILSRAWPMLFHIQRFFLIASALFLGNFVLAAAGQLPLSVIDPLWSISVEEQFYLVWPWLARGASRRGLARIAAGMIAISVVSRFVSSIMGVSPLGVWCNTLSRLDPIAAGILLATLPGMRFDRYGATARAGLALAGAGCWALVVYFFPLSEARLTMPAANFGYPLVALGAGAFLAAVLGAGHTGARFGLTRPLVYLGKISYGLYVYHFLALLMVRLGYLILDRSGHGPYQLGWNQHLTQVVYLFASLALTIALAAASYRWLETPFLRLKRRFTHVESRPV